MVAPAAQTIAFDALAPVAFGDPAFTLSATASSGLAVSFASSDPAVATVSGSTVTIVGPGTTTITASFFDPKPDVTFKLPFEFKAGAAWIGSLAQVEVDLLTYTGGDPYQALQSTESWTIITDPGTGGTPAAQHLPFEQSVIDPQAVVDLALGGQVNLTSSGSWKLHGGYATDRSPAGPDDEFFTKIDMQAFTAGVSGRAGIVLASIGIRDETGKSHRFSARG